MFAKKKVISFWQWWDDFQNDNWESVRTQNDKQNKEETIRPLTAVFDVMEELVILTVEEWIYIPPPC